MVVTAGSRRTYAIICSFKEHIREDRVVGIYIIQTIAIVAIVDVNCPRPNGYAIKSTKLRTRSTGLQNPSDVRHYLLI